MPPAHQRFGSADLPVLLRAYDFRLIVDDELVLLNRTTQIVDGNALTRFNVFHEHRLDILEHRWFLQRAEHLQSKLITELSRAHQNALVHAAREQNAGIAADAAEITQCLDAVHVGHLQVQENECRAALRQLITKCCSTVRSDHLAANALAHLHDELEKIDFIIDRQHQIAFTPGHVWNPRCNRVSPALAAPDPRADKVWSIVATCHPTYLYASSNFH